MDSIEEYASLNFVPIMQKEGMEFLIDFIKKNKIINILELGTAIGYSSINMALVNPNIRVITIERDNARYLEAIKNINQFNLNNQIEVINDDIFNVELDNQFDLIFIDAAKGQNIKFFEKFKNNLNRNGFIITDNINFHGLTDKEDIKSRNVRQLVRKIREYKEYLNNSLEFKTEFLEIGDGLSISYWR